MARSIEIFADIERYTPPDWERPLFENIHVASKGGEIVCILGHSGVGKTTLIRIMLGMHPGKLLGRVQYAYHGSTMTPVAAARDGILGVLAPDIPLLPWANVLDNLRLPSRFNPLVHPFDVDEARALLRQLQLDEDILRLKPAALSYGMRHRVGFARSLIYRPAVLFLDELFTGLDQVNRSILADTLRTYVSVNQPACFLVTHDISSAIDLADRIFMFDANHCLIDCTGTRDANVLVGLMLSGRRPGMTAAARHQ